MTDDELLSAIEKLRATMVSVATGGPNIGYVNDQFRALYWEVNDELATRGVTNTIPFDDLWQWRGHWRAAEMTHYQDRRDFISEKFKPLLARLQAKGGREFEPTGWERADRTIQKAKNGLKTGEQEEDFQSVGLLCREALITLAQAVWVPERHKILDDVEPSATDAGRKLEAYIAAELSSDTNKSARAHAKAALNLALSLQHKRAANWREAAMCVEATASVVSLLAILEGRYGPSS